MRKGGNLRWALLPVFACIAWSQSFSGGSQYAWDGTRVLRFEGLGVGQTSRVLALDGPKGSERLLGAAPEEALGFVHAQGAFWASDLQREGSDRVLKIWTSPNASNWKLAHRFRIAQGDAPAVAYPLSRGRFLLKGALMPLKKGRERSYLALATSGDKEHLEIAEMVDLDLPRNNQALRPTSLLPLGFLVAVIPVSGGYVLIEKQNGLVWSVLDAEGSPKVRFNQVYASVFKALEKGQPLNRVLLGAVPLVDGHVLLCCRSEGAVLESMKAFPEVEAQPVPARKSSDKVLTQEEALEELAKARADGADQAFMALTRRQGEERQLAFPELAYFEFDPETGQLTSVNPPNLPTRLQKLEGEGLALNAKGQPVLK